MAYSLQSSSVHAISQAQILQWVAISFSRRSSWPRDRICVSCITGRFFTTEPSAASVVKNLTANSGFPGGSDSKEFACNAGDLGLISGLGRSHGGGHGNPLQYSCLENPHGQRSLSYKELDMTEWLSTVQTMQETWVHRFNPWVRKIPWRRKWQPTLVFLPGESQGQKSLVGCRLWGCKVEHDGRDLAAAV